MAAIQRQLKTGIYDLYDNDTTGFKTSINGLFYIRAPEGITQDDYPIVTYQIITTSSEYTFEGGYTPKVEAPLILFKILSNSTISTEAEDILEKLTAVYDGATLSLTGWSLVELTRQEANSVTGPYIDDQDIINLNVRYRAICHKEV